MRGRLTSLALALWAILLVGCSDSSDRQVTPEPPIEPPIEPPPTSLDETGLYSGTLVTDAGDVALMRIKLARDGKTAMALVTGDDERADIILWGDTESEDGSLVFTGENLGDDSESSVEFEVSAGEASGRLELAGLQGEFVLSVEALSANGSDLDRLSGSYLRGDNLTGETRLTVAADGTVELAGSCNSSGTASEIDPAVNLYRLKFDSDCLTLDTLISLEDLEVEGDVLNILGDDSETGIALDLYRI